MNAQLLPARMSINPEKLSDLKVVVLDFPISDVVKTFCDDVERVTGKPEYMPYRQLNNALIACAPTLTHGFEYLYTDRNTKVSHYQALAVGTPENPVCVPTSEQLFELIQLWVDEWVKQVREKGNDEVGSVCDRFLAATETQLPDWDWRAINPKSLIQDLNTQNGLAYQAVPSLLATLLHGKTCTITTHQGAQNIQWQKVQGFGGDKVGLCLVSQAFRATYINNDKEREGYFAYRLDFVLENQAGRCYPSGNLQPWIFLKLSCQRYAHELLEEPNYNRDISILLGMNEARLPDYSVDSTLVRLVVKNVKDGQIKGWNLIRQFRVISRRQRGKQLR